MRYNHRLPPTPIDRHWPCPPSKWQASTFSNATTAVKISSSTMHSTRLVVPCTSTTHLNGRVLMLHPWAETAERFRQQTTVLTRKLNQAGYDCIFLQAPHTLPSTSTFVMDNGGRLRIRHEAEHPHAWFLYDSQDASNAKLSHVVDQHFPFIGLDTSLDLVQAQLAQIAQEAKPTELTALLGFSQGAVLGHVVSLLAQREPYLFGSLGACILASGLAAQHEPESSSRYDTGRLCDREEIHLPSLHIIGKKDHFVKPSLSLDLASLFKDARVFWHERGHILSQSSALCAQVVDFLEECHVVKTRKT